MSSVLRRTLICCLALALLSLGPPARAQKLVTLERAYALALKNHPSIQMLQERVKQAEAARYRAWSRLKPTLPSLAQVNIAETCNVRCEYRG